MNDRDVRGGWGDSEAAALAPEGNERMNPGPWSRGTQKPYLSESPSSRVYFAIWRRLCNANFSMMLWMWLFTV